MKPATFFVDSVGMSCRPEYYSGRGPTPSDLDSRMLERMFKAILEHNGKAAAESFVDMVASLKSASATAFLRNFYDLERRGWIWPVGMAADPQDYDLGGDREALGGVAVGTALSTLFRVSGNDEGASDRVVRGQFLRSHGYKLDESKRWRKKEAASR